MDKTFFMQKNPDGFGTASKDRPYGTEIKSLGRIIQAFKSITTHSYIQVINDYDLKPFQKRLWQRNYFEHIIRSDKELDQIRQYIQDNPANWEIDNENPGKKKDQ
jgi:putative transposase